jgi:hypothetical protein
VYILTPLGVSFSILSCVFTGGKLIHTSTQCKVQRFYAELLRSGSLTSFSSTSQSFSSSSTSSSSAPLSSYTPGATMKHENTSPSSYAPSSTPRANSTSVFTRPSSYTPAAYSYDSAPTYTASSSSPVTITPHFVQSSSPHLPSSSIPQLSFASATRPAKRAKLSPSPFVKQEYITPPNRW